MIDHLLQSEKENKYNINYQNYDRINNRKNERVVAEIKSGGITT